jgi:hypothetical protein
MAVLRMVAFEPFEAEGGPGPGGGRQAGDRGAEGTERGGDGPAPAAAAPAGSPGPSAQTRPEPGPPATEVGQEPAPAALAPVPDNSGPAKAEAGTSDGAGDSEWEATLGQLRMSPAWRSVLETAVARDFTAERVTLAVPREQQLNAESTRFREALDQALSDHFGARPRVEIEALDPDGDAESPAAARERQAREAQQAAEQALANDPQAQVLQERFGAQVESVRPDDGGPDQDRSTEPGGQA